ncbi:MAG: YdcF family protein [Beijerinckiaceae bacterium]
MFYYLAKVFWLFAAPTNFLFFLIVTAAIALTSGYRRVALWMAWLAVLLFLAAGPLPLNAWLLRPLEDRFPMPDLAGKDVTGIVVLGGGVDQMRTIARGQPQLNFSGGRMVVAAALAKRFPKAKMVFSGGSAPEIGIPVSEAAGAEKFFVAMGLERSRLVFEDRSRDTYENAIFTRNLLQPKPGETWILVTSAFHMPRSVGIFRKAGFRVVPYPSDYKTDGDSTDYWWPTRSFSENLVYTDTAAREWIGLLAYYLTGRSDALLPGPAQTGQGAAQSLRGSPSR